MDHAAARVELLARGFQDLEASGSNTRKDYFLSRAVHQICGRQAWPFLETTATGASPLTISDCGRVLSVVDTTNEAVLTYEDYRTLREWDPKLDDLGNPTHWYQTSSTVISCWPTTSTTLSVRYLKIPASIEAGLTAIPERFHYLVIEGACAYAYRDVDNPQMADVCSNAFEEGLLAMGDELLVVNYDSLRSVATLGVSTDW